MEKRKNKSLSERIIEVLLLACASITSIAVVLIVIFLFSEGLTVFGEQAVGNEYIVAVNKSNQVNILSSQQIKDIFDQKYYTWKEAGGSSDSIIRFRMEDITDYYSEEEIGASFEHLPEKISELVSKNPGMIAFFSRKYLDDNFKGKIIETEKITAANFLGGKEWFPTAVPAAQLGILPLILGTVWVTLGAILFALPFGIACAIYMSEIANSKVRSLLKPVIELLAGIPSVVYGFFGLVVLVPGIQDLFGLPVGETALAGSIILGIMALPTIITISEDAIRNTPRAMKEASLALGATKWQTIARVVLPYASSGITTAAILGIGRAVGETMAVLMVTGNAASIPSSFLQPVRTIPATIAAELGEASAGGLHYKSLFALGCILFLITLVINLAVGFVSHKRKLYNQ